MPPNHFESEVESFLEGSHGDRTHIKRADHHTVTPLCGTLLTSACPISTVRTGSASCHRNRISRCSLTESASTNFDAHSPAPQGRKVDVSPTHFVHPQSWPPTTLNQTFSHHKAERSGSDQLFLSFNPRARGRLSDKKIAGTKRSRRLPVGVAGFEPTASSSRTKRATKLRHTPVPFEYSVSSPIIPNGDQASGISVSHAALDWSVGGCLARNRRDANTLATPGIHMSRRPVYVCGYAGYTCRSDASGRVAMRTFA